jgi:hypothetical protein
MLSNYKTGNCHLVKRFFFKKGCTFKQLAENKFLNKIKNLIIDNFVIIQPDSLFKIIWDTFILLLLIFNIFYIPLKIAFADNSSMKDPSSLQINQTLKIILDDIPGENKKKINFFKNKNKRNLNFWKLIIY